jgi:uncharacterized protein (TIGR02217 family)
MFPNLPGRSWSIKRTPMFSTKVATHVSGREVRLAQYAHGLYQWELTFEGLASDASAQGLFANSMQMLLDIYVAAQGQAGTFVYVDNADNFVKGAAVGTGDGVTTTFPLYRRLILTSEPVSYCTYIYAVYIDGVKQMNDWNLVQPSSVKFSGPPSANSVITADFTYGWLCRFMDDEIEFEQFMSNLWAVKSLKFKSVKV